MLVLRDFIYPQTALLSELATAKALGQADRLEVAGESGKQGILSC